MIQSCSYNRSTRRCRKKQSSAIKPSRKPARKPARKPTTVQNTHCAPLGKNNRCIKSNINDPQSCSYNMSTKRCRKKNMSSRNTKPESNIKVQTDMHLLR